MGIFNLTPDGAMAFHWLLAIVSFGLILLSLLLIVQRLTVEQWLVLGPDSLLVPASRWSSKVKEILYQDIRDLSHTSANSQQFLYVLHPHGKYTITASMLPSKEAFEEVRRLLTARMRKAQEPHD
jgi:hypothetical protein